jgi:acyl carrier protein
MSASVLDRVIQVIVQSADLKPGTQVDANTTFVEAGLSLDSITLLTMLIGLEAEFNVEITAEELVGAKGLQSVGQLASLVETKVGAGREVGEST